MIDKILDLFFGGFAAEFQKNPKFFLLGAAFLVLAMGTIFVFMQTLKRVIRGFRKSENHGIPLLLLIVAPYPLGYGFMWLHHAIFPIFNHSQMVAIGIALGIVNVAIYHLWKLRTKIRITFGKTDGK